jgi:hypothetical protein
MWLLNLDFFIRKLKYGKVLVKMASWGKGGGVHLEHTWELVKTSW